MSRVRFAPFGSLPIRRKLVIVSMAACSAAVLVACIGLVASEALRFRRDAALSLTTSADIVAANSRAAILFEDVQAASETLAALGAKPAILSACIFLPSGAPFAIYSRHGVTETCGTN